MMRLFLAVLAILCTCAVLVQPASADWRWTNPSIKKVKPKLYDCKTSLCKQRAKQVAKLKFKLKVAKYYYKKEREWHRWTTRYIPPCTWYGESGHGPEFSPARYVMMNSMGSGARGKYQFKPDTYTSRATYFDWSPLDQEIAGHREFWAHGTAPWSNCS